MYYRNIENYLKEHFLLSKKMKKVEGKKIPPLYWYSHSLAYYYSRRLRRMTGTAKDKAVLSVTIETAIQYHLL